MIDRGHPIEIGSRKQRALLCLLLLHHNRVVTTDRILDALWGDEAPNRENAMWVLISRLRSALEPNRDGHGGSNVLLTRDHGYLLQVEAESIDLARFELGVEHTRQLLQNDPRIAVEEVDSALALWRGAAMEEFQHDEFAQLDVARLEDLRLEALELRAEAELRLGRAREQVAALETLQAQNPYRERLVELLMRSQYQAGQQADALRVFGRHRRRIGEELGIEASPELRRLEEQILLHDPTVRTALHPSTSTSPQSMHNPFKGLRAFNEDDGADFFGRDKLVSEVIRRIDAGQRLVALVGSSGSGKSSAVRAGVLPAVRKGAIDGSDDWLIAQMVPGSRPFVELEAALLRSSLDTPDSLAEQLADRESGLLRAALRILPGNSRLLLVIDQFEELFTLVDNETERVDFLSLIVQALDEPHGRVIVVLTLRADFYERPLLYPDFAERLGDGIVNVSELTSDELEAAVREPLRPTGVAVEPALLAALLTDVIGQPGVLPLFQYTLTMLFDRRDDSGLSIDAYRSMEGIKGALAQRAEDLWLELTDVQKSAARQLFLRLVTITGDRDWSRRRVTASELTSLRHDLAPTQRVIESFGEHRLLAFDRDPASGSPTLEVAHEALLTEWPRLRGWIAESRDDVVRHAAFVVAMTEWRAAACNPDYLLVGQRLADYETWAKQSTIDLTDPEQDFLDHSVTVRDDADRGEQERADREAALARGVRRRTVGLLTILTLVIAGGLVIWIASRPDDRTNVAYVANSHQAAVHLQASAGWTQAMRDGDFEAVRLTPRSDTFEEVSALATAGQDLIVLAPDFAPVVDDLARAYPDTWFVTFQRIDSDLPNVTYVEMAGDTDGSYLAGVAAALTTEVDAVGFLGAHPWIIDPFRSGFESGVRSVDPNIEIHTTYMVQDGTSDQDWEKVFARPIEGAQAARKLFELGADVVFHAAGGSGALVPEVAVTTSVELDRHLWVIGVDVDQWLAVGSAEREHVLTSVIKRGDRAVSEPIRLFLADELEAGTLSLGFPDDAYGFSESGDHLSLTAIDELESIEQDLANETIEVPTIPDGPPTLSVDADAAIVVSSSGSECTIDAPSTVFDGDAVRVEFRNDGDAVAGLFLFDDRFAEHSIPSDARSGFSFWSRPDGGRNASVLRPPGTGPWTIACLDEQFSQIGLGAGFDVVER